MSAGQQLLFFLRTRGGLLSAQPSAKPEDPPGYVGYRFPIGDDGRVSGNGTEVGNAGPAALLNTTVEDAKQLIVNAIAEAPLPDVPTWLQPFLSPTPVSSTSPSPGPSTVATAAP
jgi:hypothetical protein